MDSDGDMELEPEIGFPRINGMDSDSDEDMELEAEIIEILAFETATVAALRAGDPEMAVFNADGSLRCPICSPSKRKQSYAYQDLLQHVTALAVGTRGAESRGKHSALKLYLEAMAPPPVERVRESQGEERRPPRRAGESKLVCPWSVIVFQSSRVTEQEGQAYLGKNEIKSYFAEFKIDKVHVVYGPMGHTGFSILQFGRGFEALNDAMAVERYFVEEEHDRRDYLRNLASGDLGGGIYGWLARDEDLNGGPGSEGGAVSKRVSKFLQTYGDLKDIGMMGDEIKKIHDLQLKQLLESLEAKEKESLTLKKELEIVQRRAEAEKLERQESLKHGTWKTCQIL